MRKIVYLILSIVLITIVAGCQNNTKKKSDPNDEIKIAKTTKSLKIVPLKIKSDHDLTKNKKMRLSASNLKSKI